MFKSLLLLLLVFSFPVNAIVNIDKINVTDEDQTTQGEISFDLSGASGNTDTQATSLGGRLQWNNQSTQFVVLKYDYAKSSGIKNTDKTFLHYRYINNAKNTSTWESFLQVQDDEFKKLKLRTLVGAGYRLNLLTKSKQSQSRVGVGLFYSREEQDDSFLTIEELVRANIYFTYHLKVNNTVNFLSTTYYQPDIDSFADYRALEQLSFEFNLSKDLLYFVTIDIAYDNEPVIGLEKADTSYKSGITYRF